MKLTEWQRISGPLFASFPSANVTAETLVAYFGELASFETADVAAAARYFQREGGAFAPSLPELRRRVESERAERVAYERLPDFTGSHALPEAELIELQTRGIAIGAGSSTEVGALDGIGRELGEASKRIGAATSSTAEKP